MTERSFSLEYHGWGAAMSNWYARSADVLNRGAGGYNSKWLRKCLPVLLGNEIPDMAVLFIGNNDAVQEGGEQHVPLVEYKANIIAILEHLHNVNNDMAVLLISTTRVNEHMKPNSKDARRRRYTEVLRFIHRNRARPEILDCGDLPQSMALVDLWGGDSCNDSVLAARLDKYSITADDLHDGSHLNISGNKKMFHAIKDTINSEFPHLSPDFNQPPTLRTKRTSSSDLKGMGGMVGGMVGGMCGGSSSGGGSNVNSVSGSAAATAMMHGPHAKRIATTTTSNGSSSSSWIGVVHNNSSNSNSGDVAITPSTASAASSITATSLPNPNPNSTKISAATATTAASSAITGVKHDRCENHDEEVCNEDSGPSRLRWTVPRWRALV
eukprot:CAMPEP_0170438274 /NCGR_PEP_ID=MMETSP0117_2-20130122/45145_1 /TAXON_ID=400756 /ORGANISM="Durinskia baltica, Strain CSIRO CS-38" /LENGTH=382 /DNA_ID=CAMNT_0010698481 /DNA_START=137 /DNA_END=1285 /DNA_ORIENTATION=-